MDFEVEGFGDLPLGCLTWPGTLGRGGRPRGLPGPGLFNGRIVWDGPTVVGAGNTGG